MIGSIFCVYETPCGWCSKWVKKCNSKQEKDTCKTNNRERLRHDETINVENVPK